jgi:hypothetical protein
MLPSKFARKFEKKVICMRQPLINKMHTFHETILYQMGVLSEQQYIDIINYHYAL